MRGVVVIVIDCLRADHLSSYGYDRATTPTIDAMADRGVLWENVYAASSWTKPSVTSIFTGVYPSQHGVFRGIKRSRGRTEVTTDVLRSSQPTLAEKFTAGGWRCGAFINNAQLGEYAGLDRGFEAYVPDAGKADRLLGLFTDWLDADSDRPFFGYLHLLEAHWPYKPRRRHMAMFGGDRDSNYFKDHSAKDFGKLRRAIRRKETELSDDQLTQMVQMYDGAVRRLDGKVKVVLAALRDRGLEDESAVFVTADHGEEFLEHDQIGHGQSLYDELVHVPLVGMIPGVTGGERRSAPMSQVDLSALLLSVTGLQEPETSNPFVSPATDKPVFGELSTGSRYVQTIRTQQWKLHRRYKLPQSPDGERRSKTPYEQAMQLPDDYTLELYDLAIDPAEQVDLAQVAEHVPVRDQLVARLDGWWKDVACVDAEEAELDPRVVQRLRDLGYID